MRLLPRDLIAVGLVTAAIGAPYLLFGEAVMAISLPFLITLAIVVQIKSHRDLRDRMRRIEQDYRQIEAMFSLMAFIKPKVPLPPMRRWATSPDFVNLLITCLEEQRPRFILELGSGVSTILMAYCLKEIGGHIFSPSSMTGNTPNPRGGTFSGTAFRMWLRCSTHPSGR